MRLPSAGPSTAQGTSPSEPTAKARGDLACREIGGSPQNAQTPSLLASVRYPVYINSMEQDQSRKRDPHGAGLPHHRAYALRTTPGPRTVERMDRGGR